MADDRALRIASNEARFRDINERLRQDLEPLGGDEQERVAFVCECGRTECRDAIELSLAEYESVRRSGETFAVAVGHELEDVEDVVGRGDRYVIVRKKPATRPYVRARDPRR